MKYLRYCFKVIILVAFFTLPQNALSNSFASTDKLLKSEKLNTECNLLRKKDSLILTQSQVQLTVLNLLIVHLVLFMTAFYILKAIKVK